MIGGQSLESHMASCLAGDFEINNLAAFQFQTWDRNRVRKTFVTYRDF